MNFRSTLLALVISVVAVACAEAPPAAGPVVAPAPIVQTTPPTQPEPTTQAPSATGAQVPASTLPEVRYYKISEG